MRLCFVLSVLQCSRAADRVSDPHWKVIERAMGLWSTDHELSRTPCHRHAPCGMRRPMTEADIAPTLQGVFGEVRMLMTSWSTGITDSGQMCDTKPVITHISCSCSGPMMPNGTWWRFRQSMWRHGKPGDFSWDELLHLELLILMVMLTPSDTFFFCTCLSILYATGEAEDLDLDEILRDGHLCLF